ncbi:hypothetical protein RDI58_014904 [Solanum bulbocastanum]|uniref:DUF4378 domain-containing protein n=1 Tax=Solanum bulbocastanum TaxID=147425 RepID=A0AAN8TGS5_SOLBU
MGLEELPHKLPLLDNKKRRVFSENYFQKTASIGLREKSPILVGRSTRINTPKYQKVVKESWNKTHETRALSTTVDPNFHHNLRETNQTSPSSVLEQPFKEEKLCASKLNYKHADLCGAAMQLEHLASNSEETYSEGSEMAVSNEVSLTVLDYNIWNSSLCSVNSSVFGMLEKKYGKQESWPKLDRKLLFDIINSGLSEIMHSFMDIYMTKRSLKRRYHFTLGKNEVEEEL